MNNPDHAGPHGRAWFVPQTRDDLPQSPANCANWLIHCPAAHPLWRYYALMVIRLAPLPGVPDAHLQFIGATHEMLLVALNPDHEPYDVAKIQSYESNGRLPFLTPVNIVEQFEATDEEMRTLAEAAAKACCDGALTPETSDAPAQIRLDWKTSLIRTLAHIRGEEHAP